MVVTVADCEINQAAWNTAVAVAGGEVWEEVWEDDGLRWSWQVHDGQLMLNFPRTIDLAAACRGVKAARERGARIVAAWLASDTDASPLEKAGFRAWAFAPDNVAGIYDMDVWPAFQRHGLGGALLRQLGRSARAAGAQVAVINATPGGHRLYSAEGFVRVGTGITLWPHLA